MAEILHGHTLKASASDDTMIEKNASWKRPELLKIYQFPSCNATVTRSIMLIKLIMR